MKRDKIVDVNLELCLCVLDKSNIVWENIENCCRVSEGKKQERKEIWNHVLKTRKVKEIWHNYLEYYSNYGLTSELVEWLSSNIDLIIQDESSIQLTDELLKEIITSNVSIDAFTKLVKKYRVDNFDCRISSFDEERAAILIKNGWVPYTIEYLEEMKEEAPGVLLGYLCCHKEEFIQRIDSIILDVDTIADLFDSNLFNNTEKLQLLELFVPEDMTQKMAFAIRNLEIKIKKSYVESAWKLLNEKNRYQLLLNQLEVYTVEEISEKFGSLIKPILTRRENYISKELFVIGDDTMELEISVEDLLNKRKIESDRIEFKAGWNPDDIYHSVCAFANDYNNDGGGYIAVGVEEKNGVAVRPVKGIPEYMLDKIEKEMIGYNNMISPPYFPKVIPVEVDGKWILVIVARTGQQRPYKSPEYVTGKKDKKYNYYIRYLTSSVKANPEQERELINMSDQTPFDCRANHKATVDDISPVLLEDHLRKTGSKLAKQVRERGVEEILEDMQLLVGPPELRYVQNVAVMMFCEHPDKFFPYTYVQMTSFPKGSVENPSVSEDFPNITGSVPQMIQATMERFRNLFIREKVIKVPNQMEALRIMNYPYQAIEEAVVNAFYHRDYMSCEPVTIEIEPDCINIMNFPGIDRSISEKTIAEGKRFVSRYYRNRRLGEFLKELDLSEGHSSGIPTIQEELEKNGSPRAEFFTDEDRRAMRIRIPIHLAFLENNDEAPASDGYEKATNKLSKKKMEQYDKILKLMDDGDWHKTAEIAEDLGLKDTRTKELLKELVGLEKLVDNGKTKGKMYRLK